MKLPLTAKLLDIKTGGPFIVLLDDDAAKKLNVFVGDRVKVSIGKKSMVCTVDFAKNGSPEDIGIFDDVREILKIKDGQVVNVQPTTHPASVDAIRSKLVGNTLSREQIEDTIKDIAANKLTDMEVAYFVAGAFTRGFSAQETLDLTRAMVKTGHELHWPKPAVSKHCIGGISGNRTTMIIVPIVTAAGLIMPKTSSRSITSPAGTADTMEVLAPVTVCSTSEVQKLVAKVKGCIVWGGALNLAPADDKIIRAEHPLNLDPTAMLLASILAKKKSEGASRVLIDIPVGKYSKVKTFARYNTLKSGFEHLGKKLGIGIEIMRSQGDSPVGKGIGPALEARDVLWVLMRDYRAPKDLEEKSIRMAGILLKMGGKVRTEHAGKKLAKEILESGRAYWQMKKIISAQGGNPDRNPDNIKLGRHKFTFEANRKGKVVEINDDIVAQIAKTAGAPKDKGAGVYLHRQVWEKVRSGDALFTIYSNSDYHISQAKAFAFKAVKIK